MDIQPEIMSPRHRCYFTPILWRPFPALEGKHAAEWDRLRSFFAAARKGRFDVLGALPDLYITLKDAATRRFARNLLGDAGMDAHLESVENFILNNPLNINDVCDFCRSLGLWGRLSGIMPILTAYDRNFPGQPGEGLPAYLTTILEPEFGPAADYPREDTLEAFSKYETGVSILYEDCVKRLGGSKTYVFFGEEFGVRRLAERFLELLGLSRYEIMMRSYLRQRFEASTGIDCSDFYKNGDFQYLTAAERLETWLESQESERFAHGERYFFGHRIPR